jgi:uncharacterized protein (TIGR02246 family)
MTDDERAIRAVIEQWFAATKSGDVETVLGLMTDDVVFMVPGKEPFGKTEFAAAFQGMANVVMDGTSKIAELRVLGEWAYVRNHIDLMVTPPSGERVHRSGYTLTLFRKERDGRWRLARDANLLARVD